jgi:hypothetical protein
MILGKLENFNLVMIEQTFKVIGYISQYEVRYTFLINLFIAVGVMTQALCELIGKPDYPTRVIGTRHGEKKYESLLSREEMVCVAVDVKNPLETG